MLRIGELSRRVGVSEHVLRAWERRYGVLQPQRSAGGFRLYSTADEDRIRRMQAHLARGLSAAEAAAAALEDELPKPAEASGDISSGSTLADGAAGLAQTLDDMDEPAAQIVLDRLFGEFTAETVLRDVVLPYLHELGDRWAEGRASVAQEHFASNLLRGRLFGLARGWANGRGPQAVLACPPGEEHDLALLIFGIVLHDQGWRIAYLGANTPLEDLARTVTGTSAQLVVLAATTPDRFQQHAKNLFRLARTVPVAIAGAGATAAIADAIGARLLTADPVTAAKEIAAAAS
jgi:MerR family transcriptional regulator, light-induced transcriptional regulator